MLLAKIALNSSGAAIGFLNFKLKLGIFCGIISTSAIAGSTGVIVNSPEIAEKLEEVVSPVVSFFSEKVSPHLLKITQGISQISGIYNEWGKSLTSKLDPFFGWIKSQNFSRFSSGFNEIKNKFKEWKGIVSPLLGTVFENKNVILNYLSADHIKKAIFYASELSETAKAMLFMMSSALFLSFQHFITPNSSGGDNEESKAAAEGLMKIMESGQTLNLFKSVFYLVKDNLNTVAQLKREQLSQLGSFAVMNVEKFVSRIETLRNSDSKSASSQWGKYHNGSAMINDIMQNTLFNFILSPFNAISRLITTCDKKGTKGTCTDTDAFPETIITLFELFGVSSSKGKEE